MNTQLAVTAIALSDGKNRIIKMSIIKITQLNVNTLDTKDIEKIMEIFSNAFENYPLMEFFFGDTYQQSIKYLLQASIVDQLFLGAFAEDKLQGVASITSPEKSANNQDVESNSTSSEEELATVIGAESLMRIEAYSKLKKANKPQQPHFYINALGVNPKSQGTGIGSALLAKVHQMSEQHPKSCGVALDTQTEKNVSYYQRFGYSISNIVELETIKNWFMFRVNSA